MNDQQQECGIAKKEGGDGHITSPGSSSQGVSP